ncbi:hypothetical protein ACOALZ_03935 [Nocardiopsis algeriensis]|uniref:hypothetical protein n=1 Tax=Nocardiopsis algeriensis TaxID=1478215 RepID=UPI003B435ACF
MDQLTKAWVRLSTLATPTEKKNDTGAGFVEYVAIIILVAAIAVAIYSLGLVNDISGSIGEQVDSILNGQPG